MQDLNSPPSCQEEDEITRAGGPCWLQMQKDSVLICIFICIHFHRAY